MSAIFSRSFRISASTLAGVLALTNIVPTGLPSFTAPAFAQAPAQAPVDFEAALEGYGHWVQHPRLGDVWVPDNVSPDWQPYRLGHWVYTDEWGWYWDSDEDFGWVTRRLMDVADASAGGRVVSVLEGGYDLRGLQESVAAHVTALMGK